MDLDSPNKDRMCGASIAPGAVLLALGERGRPRVALLRAYAWARILGVELRVLRVVPQMHRRRLCSSRRRALYSLQRERRRVGADRLTQAWVEETLGAALPSGALETRDGEFDREVTEHSFEIGARLIVMSGSIPRLGERSARIARASQRPVMVARPSLSERAIIAATDLRDVTMPVVRKALEIARHLDASDVVAVHNISPLLFWTSAGVGMPTATPEDEPIVRSRRQRLAHATGLDQLVRGVVLRGFDPVDAIEARAREVDADLIVVGTRPSSWWSRALGRSVAERVVDAAVRSVLVMPLSRVN